MPGLHHGEACDFFVADVSASCSSGILPYSPHEDWDADVNTMH